MTKVTYFALTVAIVLLATASAQAGVQLIRNPDGKARYVTHYEASGVNPLTGVKERPDLCEASGNGHFPTIRELAMESQANGAKGILEINQVGSGDVPAGFTKIIATNPDGQKDEFYFDWHGFNGFSAEYGYDTDWIWSSSIFATDTRFAYFLGEAIGDLGHFYRNDADDGLATVICISK